MFPQLLFCENEPSLVISLWTWDCLARSVTDLLLVGNWSRAPDSFQLSQPRASVPQSRITTDEVATESTKPLFCYSGFDKNKAFPWVPLLITPWTILSNSSQLVCFHAIHSNYSRKPDWRPLYFSLPCWHTAFLLSLGLQAPLRGITTKTYAPWLHIFQFVSAYYFFLFTASWVVAEVAYM